MALAPTRREPEASELGVNSAPRSRRCRAGWRIAEGEQDGTGNSVVAGARSWACAPDRRTAVKARESTNSIGAHAERAYAYTCRCREVPARGSMALVMFAFPVAVPLRVRHGLHVDSTWYATPPTERAADHEGSTHALHHALLEVPAPPCERCKHAPRCARAHLACRAFVTYANGGRRCSPGRPSRAIYRRLFPG